MRKMVDEFADSHPRFDELGKLIEIGLRGGANLKTAYAFAKAFDDVRRRKRK
jgi:hypothetical protein